MLNTGFQAFVGESDGSIFIRHLVDVFAQHSSEEDLLSLMTEVLFTTSAK